MIVFENDIFPIQVAAQSGAGKPKAAALARPMGAARKIAPAAGAPARAASVPPVEGFKGVFEAEVRSLPPRPGAANAPAGQRPANGGGFQPVFENDVLAPLPPTPPGTASGKVALWDNGGFGFSDILDVINPLQHLPIISTIYRAETGDKIGAVPRILGSMLYGGGLVGAAVGAATAVINLAVEQETGKDIGAHIYTAIFGEGGKNARSTTIATRPGIATKPTAMAPATAKAAPVALGAKPVPAAPAPAQASPPAPAAPAPAAKAGPPSGGVRVTGKGAPPTSLSAATAKSVSSQFRRSTWYRKNQDALAAQARELARAKAKAASQAPAGKSAGAGNPLARSNATGKPDMLRLFTGKPAGKSAAAATKSKPTRPKPIPRAAMATEMTKAMNKYEKLLKSRIAAGAKTNQLR